MDEKELVNYLDHQRWLINNGLVNPIVQDNLYMYGILAHPEIKEVDVILDALNKRIDYVLFFDSKMIKVINKFNELSGSKSLWGVFCLWRLLKKHGNLDFKGPIDKMIRDYCGPKWSVSVKVKHVSEYEKEFKEEWDQTNSPESS